MARKIPKEPPSFAPRKREMRSQKGFKPTRLTQYTRGDEVIIDLQEDRGDREYLQSQPDVARHQQETKQKNPVAPPKGTRLISPIPIQTIGHRVRLAKLVQSLAFSVRIAAMMVWPAIKLLKVLRNEPCTRSRHQAGANWEYLAKLYTP